MVQTYDWFVDKPEDLLAACSTGRFDIIVVAECLHKTEFHAPLLATLEGLGLMPERGATAAEGPVVFFSYQERGYEESFWPLVEERECYTFANVGTYDKTEQTKTWPVAITELRAAVRS